MTALFTRDLMGVGFSPLEASTISDGVDEAVRVVYGLSTGTSSSIASTNTSLINAALAHGGVVQILAPTSGSVTYYINGSLVAYSKTLLMVGPGVTLYRATATNAPLLKSKYAAYLDKESRFTRTSNVATVLDVGHTLSVGDQVYVTDLTDTTFNGLQTVTSIVAATSWTYGNVGANYSSGSATKWGGIIPVRRTIQLASFTANTDFPANAATGYTYVADVNTDVRVGFLIWISSVGVVEVRRVDATGFTYFGAIPTDSTVALSYDYDITIDGGVFNGNRAGQTFQTNSGLDTSVFRFGCTNNLAIRNCRIGGTQVHAIWPANCQQYTLENVEFFDCIVGSQNEGGGMRHRVTNCWGMSANQISTAQQQDDFLAWVGVIFDAAGAYNNVRSPYGLCNFDDIKVLNVRTGSSLNGIKITADDTITYDNFVVDGLTGGSLDPVPLATPNAGVRVQDDGTGLTGTTVKKLVLKNIDWRVASGANGRAVQMEGTGSIQDLTFDNGGFVGTTASTGGLRMNNSFTVQRAVVGGVRWSDPITAGSFFFEQAETSVMRDLTIEQGDFTFSATTASRIYGSASGNVCNRLTLRDLTTHGNAANIGCLVRHIGQLDNLIFDNVQCVEATNCINSMYECRAVNLPTTIYVNNCNVRSSVAFGDGAANIGTSAITINMNNSKWTASGGNNFLQFGSAGATQVNFFGGPNNQFTGLGVLILGAVTFRINCPSLPVNIATYAAVGTRQLNGDQVYNTNAATGTITSAGVLTYQTLAAAKWIMPLTVTAGVPTFATN